jgi:hypothetical protein
VFVLLWLMLGLLMFGFGSRYADLFCGINMCMFGVAIVLMVFVVWLEKIVLGHGLVSSCLCKVTSHKVKFFTHQTSTCKQVCCQRSNNKNDSK